MEQLKLKFRLGVERGNLSVTSKYDTSWEDMLIWLPSTTLNTTSKIRIGVRGRKRGLTFRDIQQTDFKYSFIPLLYRSSL